MASSQPTGAPPWTGTQPHSLATPATLLSVFSAVPRQLRCGKSLMTPASKSESIDSKQRNAYNRPPPRQQSTSTSSATAEHTLPHTRSISCTLVPFFAKHIWHFYPSLAAHSVPVPTPHCPPPSPFPLSFPLGRVWLGIRFIHIRCFHPSVWHWSTHTPRSALVLSRHLDCPWGGSCFWPFQRLGDSLGLRDPGVPDHRKVPDYSGTWAGPPAR